MSERELTCDNFQKVGLRYREHMGKLRELEEARRLAELVGGEELTAWKAKRDVLNREDQPIVPLFLCGAYCEHIMDKIGAVCPIERRLIETGQQDYAAELQIRLPARQE